jgi:glycosyltransferase involved in cell wall biosynthesis
MIILSDCFTLKVDEGCLKVANSLTRKIKAKEAETLIISYNRESTFSDHHLKLNKLFLNKELFSIIKSNKGPVLYIPFASNTMASVLRAVILSFFSKTKVSLLSALRIEMNPFAKLLLRISGARVIALSKDSYNFYKRIVGKSACYLKTGVDVEKFNPVSVNQKSELKKKYDIPAGMIVVLHIGHLKANRNIDKLIDIDSKYFVLLVVSSVTEKEKDDSLRIKLGNRPNTRIIEEYIENIQEIYQMSDVYLFPVQTTESCIDVPLSVLEAAACNIPIVTTPYGELKEFIGNEGFYILNTCDKEEINQLIDLAIKMKTVDTRKTIIDYDWNNSIIQLENNLRGI